MGLKLYAAIVPLSLLACSPPAPGTSSGVSASRGSKINWTVAPDDSVGQISKSSVARCWKTAGEYDCLHVTMSDAGDMGKLYTALRYKKPRLAVDEWEYADIPINGYNCQVMEKLGLAEEGYTGATGNPSDYSVSLRGEEPIGRPQRPDVVQAALARIVGPKALYFDCVELGGILLKSGLPAVLTQKISRRQMMP